MIDLGSATCSVDGLTGQDGDFNYRVSHDWLGRVTEDLTLGSRQVARVRRYTVQAASPQLTPGRFVRRMQTALSREDGCKRMAWQQAGCLIGLAVLAQMTDPTSCTYASGDFAISFEGRSSDFTTSIEVQLSKARRSTDRIGVDIYHASGEMPWQPRQELGCGEIVRRFYEVGWTIMHVGRPDWRMQVGVEMNEEGGLRVVQEFAQLVASSPRLGLVGSAVSDMRAELLDAATVLDAALFTSTELFRLTSLSHITLAPEMRLAPQANRWY